jgi:hypothetical protein
LNIRKGGSSGKGVVLGTVPFVVEVKVIVVVQRLERTTAGVWPKCWEIDAALWWQMG